MKNIITLNTLLTFLFAATLTITKAAFFAIPKAPQTLAAATVSPAQITLTWVDASTDETGFELERSLDGKAFTKLVDLAANVVTYQNTALKDSTQYWYRIRAKNASGFSLYSNIATAVTKPPLITIPKVPATLTAAAVSGTEINISWADQADNETGFELERSSDGTSFLKIADLPANAENYENTGLLPVTKYWYRILAKNSAGKSAYSNIATATTKDVVPNAPGNLVGVAVSSSEVSVKWMDMSDNETGFQLERSLNGTTFSKIADLAANVTSYQNTGLSPATSYYYRIRAVNAIGFSAYSEISSVATQNIPVPDRPEHFTAVPVAPNLIQLRWDAITGSATEVIIERSKGSDDNFAQINKQAATILQYQDTEELEKTDYYYRVKAINAGGSSQYSLIAIVRESSIITAVEPEAGGNLVYVSGKTLVAELKTNIPATLYIYDLSGNVRKNDTIGQSSRTDLGIFSAGMYIVVIRRDQEVISRKIVLY